MQTFEKVRIFGSPCCVPRLRRKQPIECLKKFCVRNLKGMSKGSRACVNFEGKIRTQNFLKVNSELYTTAVFQFWSYPCFGHAFATAHPPLLSGSARGIFLVVPCNILYLGERGLLGHSLHFQSFLNVNCTVHSSQI